MLLCGGRNRAGAWINWESHFEFDPEPVGVTFGLACGLQPTELDPDASGTTSIMGTE